MHRAGWRELPKTPFAATLNSPLDTTTKVCYILYTNQKTIKLIFIYIIFVVVGLFQGPRHSRAAKRRRSRAASEKPVDVTTIVTYTCVVRVELDTQP